jgi:hypothetical protein
MYIDQNLMNDTDFLLEISEAFSEIIGTIKYYPYPTMVYKIEINKYIKKSTNTQSMDANNTVAPVTKIADIIQPQTATKQEEK